MMVGLKASALLVSVLCWTTGFGSASQLSTPESEFVDHEQRLVKTLLANYDKTIRPGLITRNGTKEPLKVNVQLALRRIVGTDDRFETMSLFMFIIEEWIDPRLKWNPEDFGNLQFVMIPADLVWTPQAYLPNLAIMDPSDKKEQFSVYINQSDRTHPKVESMTYALLQERCKFEMTYFPFDHQQCEMCLVNNQYHESLVFYEPRIAELEAFSSGGEWDLVNITVSRPSSDPFMSSACFTITVQRRSIYYVVNLFLPTITIGLLNTIGLFAAIDSDHKELEFSSLGQTTLLALGVMLLTVADETPRGEESISLLGIFFLAMIFQTLFAALTAVFLKKLSKTLEDTSRKLTAATVGPASSPTRGINTKRTRWTAKRVARLCMILHLLLIAMITVVALGVGCANKKKRLC